jgi:aspartate/methionine/tyrosine aminotransferase
LPALYGAEAAWRDEVHVVQNRQLYREKYAIADQILGQTPGYKRPDAGFFLWLRCKDGEEMARQLWSRRGIRVLPGAYLSRPDREGADPGRPYIRVALVESKDQIEVGLTAIRESIADTAQQDSTQESEQ